MLKYKDYIKLAYRIVGRMSKKELLEGVIDMHIHAGPDVVPRYADGLEIAREAAQYCMRALVFKPFIGFPNAQMCYMINKLVPEIKVFGGVILNYAVGGLNPEAVFNAIQLEGTKVVWMPQLDAEHCVKKSEQVKWYRDLGIAAKLGGIVVAKGGKLVPEAEEIINLLAENKHIILATGHISPEESLILIGDAKKAGVEKIIVTHVNAPLIGATLEEQKEMARKGAYLEYSWCNCTPFFDRQDPAELVTGIKEIGAEHIVITTDLGQPFVNPSPAEGMANFIACLLEKGVSKDEVDLMARKNPAKLLDLE